MNGAPKSLALFGVGRWGKNLARNFHSLGVLHTICDTNTKALDPCKSLYPDVATSTSVDEVLANSIVTKVAIAAPAFHHFALAKKALLACKDVYVEKPLCMNVFEANELIRLATEKNRILMVGHLLQYHPCVNKLQKLIQEGELGKLQYIASNRLNLGSIRTEENALWNFAPHDISVILSLVGDKIPLQVQCTGEAYISEKVADTTMTTMRFEGNIMAHIYVSWLHPFKEQKLVVIGSGGMAVFDDTKPWKEKLLLYRNHIRWSGGQIPQTVACEPENVIVDQSEPLRNECSHFIECCSTRTQPLTDGHEALRVLKVLEKSQESLNEKGAAKDPQKLSSFFAHPSSFVDPSAEIGTGTKVWHFSHIMEKAKVGESCNIGQNVVINPGVSLGKNVKIQNNVSVYTGVQCEDDVFLGPSMVFTNIANPRSEVVRKNEYEPTIVRKGASIGANATILCGIEMGQYCFIGAGAVVTKNVKPYALVVGNPGKQVGWISRHGERLDLPLKLQEDEVKEASCPKTGEIFVLKGEELTPKSS